MDIHLEGYDKKDDSYYLVVYEVDLIDTETVIKTPWNFRCQTLLQVRQRIKEIKEVHSIDRFFIFHQESYTFTKSTKIELAADE